MTSDLRDDPLLQDTGLQDAASSGDWFGAGAVPSDAAAALSAAAAAWTDEPRAEAHIRAALAAAPDHPEVSVGAYKFYFYKHRYREAVPLALWCVTWALARLGLEGDWRQVAAADAAFADLERMPRFFLFALKAYGYVLVRAGETVAGREAVAKVASLDLGDRVGASRLLTVIDRGGVEDEDA